MGNVNPADWLNGRPSHLNAAGNSRDQYFSEYYDYFVYRGTVMKMGISSRINAAVNDSCFSMRRYVFDTKDNYICSHFPVVNGKPTANFTCSLGRFSSRILSITPGTLTVLKLEYVDPAIKMDDAICLIGLRGMEEALYHGGPASIYQIKIADPSTNTITISFNSSSVSTYVASGIACIGSDSHLMFGRFI